MKTRIPRKKKKQIKTFIRKNRKWAGYRVSSLPTFCCEPCTPSEAFLSEESSMFPTEEIKAKIKESNIIR